MGLLESLLTGYTEALIYKYMKIQFKESPAMTAVKIGVTRQVVIPKKLHDQLGLAPGDYLEVELEGDHLVFTPKALIEKRLAEASMTSEKAVCMAPLLRYRPWCAPSREL